MSRFSLAMGLVLVLIAAHDSQAQKILDVPAEEGALANALVLVKEGSVLRLAPGDHKGPFEILKSVTLRGRGEGRTRLVAGHEVTVLTIATDGDVSLESLSVVQPAGKKGEKKHTAVEVGLVGKLALKRCTIEGSHHHGLHVVDAKKLVMADCQIQGNLGAGAFVVGGEADIKRCEFLENGMAGLIAQDTDLKLLSLRVTKNKGEGVLVRGLDSRADVRGLIAAENQRGGLTGQDGCRLLVSGPSCVNNRTAGLQVSGEGSQMTVEGGTFQGNDIGIAYRAGAVGSIANAEISESKKFGLLTNGDSSKLTCKDVTIAKVGKHGILCNLGAMLIAEKCEIEQTKESGIMIEGEGSSGEVRRCTITECNKHAIALHDKATGKCISNKLNKNRQNGICVQLEGTEAFLEQNECCENGGSGIEFWKGGSGTAQGNTCDHNKTAGISFSFGPAKAILKKNRCSRNAFGVAFNRGAEPFDIPKDNRLKSNSKGSVKRK